jgi:hypothetical protein
MIIRVIGALARPPCIRAYNENSDWFVEVDGEEGLLEFIQANAPVKVFIDDDGQLTWDLDHIC